MRFALLFCLLVVLVACGVPRQPVLTADQAMAESRVLDLRVVKLHDAMTVKGLTQGSHLIEVEIYDGIPEYCGRIITLPYDEWAVGGPPPAVGTRLHIAPRMWLVTASSSRGKPLVGWEESADRQRRR